MTFAKILIVEDDQNLLATLKYNLLKESYNVITAIDGARAIETAIKAMKSGACDYIIKPFNPDDVVPRLRDAIVKQAKVLQN